MVYCHSHTLDTSMSLALKQYRHSKAKSSLNEKGIWQQDRVIVWTSRYKGEAVSMQTPYKERLPGHLYCSHDYQLFPYLNFANFWSFLCKNDAEELIHAFVTSRLDYCNARFSSYPDKALNKLQLVLKTAARILTRTPTFDHILPVLTSTLASC